MTYLELRAGAKLSSIRVLNELLDVALRELAVDEATAHDVSLAVAELVANVCVHEYPRATGEVERDVSVRLEARGDDLLLTVVSRGPAFDLQAALARAETHDPLAELDARGLGLPLLAALFDAVHHEHEDGVGNRITLRRSLTS